MCKTVLSKAHAYERGALLRTNSPSKTNVMFEIQKSTNTKKTFLLAAGKKIHILFCFSCLCLRRATFILGCLSGTTPGAEFQHTRSGSVGSVWWFIFSFSKERRKNIFKTKYDWTFCPNLRSFITFAKNSITFYQQ